MWKGHSYEISDETYKKALELIVFDAIEGVFRWRNRPEHLRDSKRWNGRYAGTRCGALDSWGYTRITFKSLGDGHIQLRAHRLVWFMFYGEIPDGEIDHINRIKTDNRVCNLRVVTREINQKNLPMNARNKSGVTGVHWDKDAGKWRAQSGVGGKHYNLGRFDDINKAQDAVMEFRAKHGFTGTHGAEINE